MHSLLLAAAQAMNDNPTELNRWQGTPIMIGCCLLVLFIASRTIEYPHQGPKMPLGPLAPLFNNISVAAFLGAMSFGHILGALAILGTASWLQ